MTLGSMNGDFGVSYQEENGDPICPSQWKPPGNEGFPFALDWSFVYLVLFFLKNCLFSLARQYICADVGWTNMHF